MASLFEELKRRNVIRIVIAYLALAWLILQVLDVTTPILDLPSSTGRYVFFMLAVGFPIAVVLAWVYDVTPAGIIETTSSADDTRVAGFGGRRIDLGIIATLSLAVVILIINNYVLEDLDGIPEVSKYDRITRSQVTFPPMPSPYPLVADATRLYFSTWRSGILQPQQLLQSGGEAIPLNLQFPDKLAVTPIAVTPDRSHLIIETADVESYQRSLWQWPVVGGAPRRLGEGTSLQFIPGGEQVFLTDGFSLARLADSELKTTRDIFKVSDKITWPAISGDARTVRFTHISRTGSEQIWEAALDGSAPQRWLPRWTAEQVCCGSWTPDGRHYIFQAVRDGRSQLWAVREDKGIFGTSISDPAQITTGALDFRRPTLSPDGNTIFAIGWQLQGEAVIFDRSIRRFIPLAGLESESAEWITYSKDREWMAYVRYPEGSIWRSRTDGSNRLQLTFEPMRASDLEWSPDGRTIAFKGVEPGKPENVFIVSADGGNPQRIGDPNRPSRSPSWSPDSNTLAFDVYGRDPIQLYDMETGDITEIGAPHELDYPKWSPDGRYFTAQSSSKLRLYDTVTGTYDELLELQPFTNSYWSTDSQYVYFHDSPALPNERRIRRIHIGDRTIQNVATYAGVRLAWGSTSIWIGSDPDGAPMMLRDLSIHHIYALEWPVKVDSSAD
jgi:Tol biopolymer transport system component